MPSATPELARYRVTGMDCTSCVKKIEGAARELAGVREVKVSLASQLLTLSLDPDAARTTEIEHAITSLGYGLERLDPPTEAAPSSADGEPAVPRSPVTPAYRRALWAVVLLNLGYGVVETVAGLFAQSQSLEASALDFLGDGAIAMLGLLAVGFGLRWRARAALFQGAFLGLFGLGVLVSSLVRVFVPNAPQAEAMGAFGVLALLVNVLAAVLLVPHRTGNASVRAVWLDSRNDAIGNVAVVVAAGLVAWTGTPWPDLVVAVAVAGLFLHSSWSIVGDARAELAHAPPPAPHTPSSQRASGP